MAIITLSRELGSLGTEIADTLSSRLGYAKLDKESLEVLLRKLGMSAPRFERDDEEKPGFWKQFTQEKVRYVDASAHARDVLRDLRIAQDVIIAIAYRERVAVLSLDVVSDKGAVVLDGTVRSQAAVDRCLWVAGAVEGVAKVVSKIVVIEYADYAGF